MKIDLITVLDALMGTANVSEIIVFVWKTAANKITFLINEFTTTTQGTLGDS